MQKNEPVPLAMPLFGAKCRVGLGGSGGDKAVKV